jgi:hypothetical protein
MDTRFWGPSGWRLLHLITFTYEPSHRDAVKEFFLLVPYVLPCKFCRRSLAEYMEEDRLEPALASRTTLTQWLYRIHNKVNAKLRGQGLPTAPDPSFASVKKEYETRLAAGCSGTEFSPAKQGYIHESAAHSREFEGWEFLFSIAENHPFSHGGRNSVPFEDCPSAAAATADQRNRWNTMKPEERMTFYRKFWAAVGPALPFPEWRSAWGRCSGGEIDVSKRHRWLRSLWRIRSCLEKELDLKRSDSCFSALCDRLSAHRSGCGKRPRAKTCRRQPRANQTRKH